ncbi:MAG: DMT family transporter, partial [Lysobacter sp.]
AIGQYAITAAFRSGSASLLAPLEYTALVWGVLLDVSIWGVLPDAITWLGAGIIIASGLYMLRRERVRADEGVAGNAHGANKDGPEGPPRIMH